MFTSIPYRSAVHAHGLTPAHLGPDEFGARLHRLRDAARFHCGDDRFEVRATRDPVTGERSGYVVMVETPNLAAWLRECVEHLMRGEPMPWEAAY